MEEIFKILNRFRTGQAFAEGGALYLIPHFKAASMLLTQKLGKNANILLV